MATVIRQATIDDAEAIGVLARELNIHQGEPVEHFTAEAIRRDGFGESRAFDTIIAEVDGQAIGYAIYLATYSTEHAERGMFMHDLYVREDYRGRGIGRAIVDAVAAVSRRRGRDWVWWASKAWNQKAQAAYRAWGAIEQPIKAHALVYDRFQSSADSGERWLTECKDRD